MLFIYHEGHWPIALCKTPENQAVHKCLFKATVVEKSEEQVVAVGIIHGVF